MKHRHALSLITFFSMIVLLCILPLVFIKNSTQEVKKPAASLIPLSPDKINDLQIIHRASASGAVECTMEDPSLCQENQEGNVLEYQLGCNDSVPASSIYICKAGRWVYIDWTPHGFCHSCGNK